MCGWVDGWVGGGMEGARVFGRDVDRLFERGPMQCWSGSNIKVAGPKHCGDRRALTQRFMRETFCEPWAWFSNDGLTFNFFDNEFFIFCFLS